MLQFNIMQTKKSGIRLRHLQQQQTIQPQKIQRKRDASPNAGNRKKIFEKLPQQKPIERQQQDHKINTPLNLNENRQNGEYEKLIQNLKRKSMQIQLRDNMIKSLNREIDDLKKEVKTKDREITRLKNELERLQRTSKITKQINQDNNFYESFKDSEIFNKNRTDQEYSWNYQNQTHNKSMQRNSQEITMMNPQMRPSPSAQLRSQQPEILSPFMALANKKADADTLINQLPTQSIQREHIQTFHSYSSNTNGNSFEVINASKSNLTNPFDKFAPKKYTNHTSSNTSFAKKPYEPQYSRQLPRKPVHIDRNIDKFNIFCQSDIKSQVRQVTKLQIQDSREFKFDEFGNDYNQF